MIPIANPELTETAKRRVGDVLDSGMLADGPEVRSFEAEFADMAGADHAVATSNGTTALHAALKGLGIGAGDTVVTTPFTFIATANAAKLCGADVEFVDIDEATYNIDPDRLEARLEAGLDVDAVVAVHLFGLPADMDRLCALAEEYDFALVEDACQAHGARIDGQHVGTFGDAGCFSFYPTKNMTTGEGGIVVTDDEGVAERTRRFTDHGRVEGYEHAEVGHNFRMTSIAAAIGRVQLDRLDEFVAARRANAHALTEELSDLVRTPVEPAGTTHAYNQYTIRVDDRDALADALAERGVGSKVYYPTPVHTQAPYRDVSVDAPVAERCAAEVLSLPVHPGVTDDDVATIAAAVRDALQMEVRQ